jgi:signal peptidase I
MTTTTISMSNLDVMTSGPAAAALPAIGRPSRARRWSRRTSRWATTLLVLGAFGLGALMIVPGLFGFQRYVITGGSMTGSIARGSVAFDQVVPVDHLKIGDVITYTPPASAPVSGKVTHRLVWIGHGVDGRPAFRTKGDANPTPDPWKFQLSRRTQARVAFHVPYVGYALSALSIRAVRLLVIALPALLIALSLLVGIWRDAGRHVRELEEATAR